MAFLEDHKAKFDSLRISLDQNNIDQLKRKANGGNSIVFTCPPVEENRYIEKFKETDDHNFEIVDVASLLVQFIELDGWQDFKEYYNDFKDTPHLVFHSGDEETDLMDLILQKISTAESSGKTPVLVRTGALFGTGIENVNIMEHKIVMSLSTPLIILYPSKFENENLYFLNFKSASKYRCKVID